MTLKIPKQIYLIVVLAGLIIALSIYTLMLMSSGTKGVLASQNAVVGVTYYGGNFNDMTKRWEIDNKNQCDRIAANEFTAASLNADVSQNCNDDNGLSYINDIPLHNTVSFAELSINPASADFSALGNLAAGSRLEINYNGKCLIAEKRDVGLGGGPVNGYPRALDLWWQTARSLNFTNGFDTMIINTVPSSTPLTPLGQNTTCNSNVQQPLYSPVTTYSEPSSIIPSATNTQSQTNSAATKSEINSSGATNLGSVDKQSVTSGTSTIKDIVFPNISVGSSLAKSPCSVSFSFLNFNPDCQRALKLAILAGYGFLFGFLALTMWSLKKNMSGSKINRTFVK